MTSDRAPADNAPADNAPAVRPSGPDRDESVLPSISRDETDLGRGDEPGGRDDDWYRRERPPHHG